MSTHEVFEIATAGGSPDALFELGLMYCAGRDVERKRCADPTFNGAT
jgi:TPR repeat protein